METCIRMNNKALIGGACFLLVAVVSITDATPNEDTKLIEDCKVKVQGFFDSIEIPEEVTKLVDGIVSLQGQYSSVDTIDLDKVGHLYTETVFEECKAFLGTAVKSFLGKPDLMSCAKSVDDRYIDIWVSWELDAARTACYKSFGLKGFDLKTYVRLEEENKSPAGDDWSLATDDN